MQIDFNADLAEGSPAEEEILKLISSANISCGLHAGSYSHSMKTLKRVKELGLRAGIHPGFDDAKNFGRINHHLKTADLIGLLRYQIGALKELAKLMGVKLSYLKPHGALYNMAAKDEALADLIASQCASDGLSLMGLSGSCLLKAAKREGIEGISEVFANRGYDDDGLLIPRGQKGDILDDLEGIKQAICMIKNSYVISINGKKVPIKAQSLCIHADENGAANFAKALYEGLKNADISIKAS